MRLKLCCALLVVLLGSFGAAHALTISFSDSVPVQGTDFTDSVTVPKFDPTLGTLTSITFTLDGDVSGTAQFENRDGAATITMTLAALLELQRPDTSVIVQSSPSSFTSDVVTAYDGTTDFGGTSGRTHTGLLGSALVSAASPPPASDLTLFTATFLGETITLPVTATATSTGSGTGRMVFAFDTFAGADITVEYTYEPTTRVPEPSSLLLLGISMLGLVGYRWRHGFRK